MITTVDSIMKGLALTISMGSHWDCLDQPATTQHGGFLSGVAPSGAFRFKKLTDQKRSPWAQRLVEHMCCNASEFEAKKATNQLQNYFPRVGRYFLVDPD